MLTRSGVEINLEKRLGKITSNFDGICESKNFVGEAFWKHISKCSSELY